MEAEEKIPLRQVSNFFLLSNDTSSSNLNCGSCSPKIFTPRKLAIYLEIETWRPFDVSDKFLCQEPAILNTKMLVQLISRWLTLLHVLNSL